LLLWVAMFTLGSAAQTGSSEQSQQGNPAVPAEQPQPESVDGLHDLILQMLAAIQKNDDAHFSALAHGLILPDYQTWFVHVFGDGPGLQVAQAYEKGLPDFNEKLKKLIQGYIKDGMTEASVTRVETPEPSSKDAYSSRTINAMKNRVAIYSVEMRGPGAYGWHIPGFFAFVQGHFRFVGGAALGSLNLWPSRIRVGGNVAVARLLDRPLPVYPPEAQSRHIEGTVVLHAVLDFDGTVLGLQFVSGPPELMQSAIDAVKQWRYQPTLLNGEPVQVDTTISVVFKL